ncbi:MAG: hypothetical protein GY711_14170 [bacterium]|nr:hypothetical protein [bacterium]
MHSSQEKATWTSAEDEVQRPLGALRDRLSELALDRTSSSRELVLETCAVLRAWVHEQPLGWSWGEAVRELEEGLEVWAEGQGWRGTAARLLATLGAARRLDRHGPREVLSEELGLWLHGEADARDWSGRPLDAGRRIPDRRPTAELAVRRGGITRGLARGETILVLGVSETVVLALEYARDEGLDPHVLTGQGGPCADGLRLARRLRAAGVAVTVGWDAGLVSQIDEADRIWLGTEATDGRRFLALVGTESLLRRAREVGVPAELLVETDQHLPAGVPLRAPAWCERDAWLLWDGAPAGVELRTQAFAAVPLELVHTVGAEGPSTTGAAIPAPDRRTSIQA